MLRGSFSAARRQQPQCKIRMTGTGNGVMEGAATADGPTLRHLFEEENRKAQELLEAASHHHEQLQQKCQQLQQKRQRWAWRPCPQPPRGRWLKASLLPFQLISWSLHTLLFLLLPLPLPTLLPHPSLFRLKEELEKLGMQIPARAQSKQEEGAGPGEPVSPGIRWQGAEIAHESRVQEGKEGEPQSSQRMVFWEGCSHRAQPRQKCRDWQWWGGKRLVPVRVWAQGCMEISLLRP